MIHYCICEGKASLLYKDFIFCGQIMPEIMFLVASLFSLLSTIAAHCIAFMQLRVITNEHHWTSYKYSIDALLIVSCFVGLVVRIRCFHSHGPGSIPSIAVFLFFYF